MPYIVVKYSRMPRKVNFFIHNFNTTIEIELSISDPNPSSNISDPNPPNNVDLKQYFF